MTELEFVNQVLLLRAERGLLVVTKETPAGVVFLDRTPDELVTELLRLARLGALVHEVQRLCFYHMPPAELIARVDLPQPFGGRRADV